MTTRMLLAADIGNTQIVFGAYEGEELVADWRISPQPQRTADEYAVLLENLLAQRELTLAQITDGIISCVVPPLLAAFVEMYREHAGVEPLVVGPGVRTGLNIQYDEPRDVGADRVAGAVAVRHYYGTPAIVIDFSSTVTAFDAISAAGDYLGGAIAPGIAISAEALFHYAARLPRVELVRPDEAIGRNNAASIQSGLIYGYMGLVEGMVARFQGELGGGARVVATGGLSSVIGSEIAAIEVIDPNLTLRGLKLIYDMNREAET
jgi:type III pantothenate kinase